MIESCAAAALPKMRVLVCASVAFIHLSARCCWSARIVHAEDHFLPAPQKTIKKISFIRKSQADESRERKKLDNRF
jgi:hypothetical protein